MTRAEIEAKCQAFAKNLWMEFELFSDSQRPNQRCVASLTANVRGKAHGSTLYCWALPDDPTPEQLAAWFEKIAKSVRRERDGLDA